MRISVWSKVILLLGLVALLLEAENCEKKEKKVKRSKKKTRSTNLLLSFDSALINQADPPQISQEQSLSPWTYEVSYEKSRIPNYISEAKCDKVGCMTKEGHENLGLESKPIFYQILVLRKVKVQKKNYSFQLEKKLISVGCTCVRHHVISQ